LTPRARDAALVAFTWIAVVALYLGVGVWDHDVWAPVEPTVAGITWEMQSSGDLAVPRINGEHAFLDTPPLYYWLALAAARVSGSLDPGTLRLPAALLGVLGLGLVYGIARRAYGVQAACAAMLLAASTGLYWDLVHRAGTDVAGTIFAFVGFALHARSLEAAPERIARWDAALALVVAASFYAKNLFTGFVVLPVVAVDLVRRGELRRLVRLFLWTGLLGLVLALPWAIALHREGGWPFVRIALVDNTIGRLLPLESFVGLSDRINDAWIAEKEPYHFYLPLLFLYPTPWAPIAIVALVRLLSRGPWSELQRFLLVGLVAVPLVLSLSSAKSTDYLSPILFFVFLLLADLAAEVLAAPSRLRRWELWTIVGNLALVGAAGAVTPLALAIAFSRWWVLLFLPLTLAAGFSLAARLRARGPDRAWYLGYGVCLVAITFLALRVALPEVDARKSVRPFFEAVERELDGRALWTTFDDVYRLPLVNYSLERRVPVLPVDQVAARLSSPEPAGVVLRPSEVATLGALPGTFTLGTGDDRYLFIANGRPASTP